MLIDDKNKFITARQHPTLAVVETCFAGNTLQVNVANRQPLQLPLQHSDNQTIPVTIWKDQC